MSDYPATLCKICLLLNVYGGNLTVPYIVRNKCFQKCLLAAYFVLTFEINMNDHGAIQAFMFMQQLWAARIIILPEFEGWKSVQSIFFKVGGKFMPKLVPFFSIGISSAFLTFEKESGVHQR